MVGLAIGQEKIALFPEAVPIWEASTRDLGLKMCQEEVMEVLSTWCSFRRYWVVDLVRDT